MAGEDSRNTIESKWDILAGEDSRNTIKSKWDILTGEDSRNTIESKWDILAGGDSRDTIESKWNTLECHYVKWDVPAPEVPRLPRWLFNKNHRTCCGTSPSSWEYSMAFPSMGTDGSVSMVLCLKREEDDVKNALHAAVTVLVTDVNGSRVFPTKTFTKNRMAPGNEMRERMNYLFVVPRKVPEVDQRLTVQVTLAISSCHGKE